MTTPESMHNLTRGAMNAVLGTHPRAEEITQMALSCVNLAYVRGQADGVRLAARTLVASEVPPDPWWTRALAKVWPGQ